MLVSVLVTFLVVILVLYLINLLPLNRRGKEIARIIVIILGVISLLKYIAVFRGAIRGPLASRHRAHRRLRLNVKNPGNAGAFRAFA
jgi:Na+/melibiose symporter-like transporter